MKKVTYEQFINIDPYWTETEEGKEKLKKYKSWWKDDKTALDILSFEEIGLEDRLCTVLRPEFIDEPILHEFACRCAEKLLSHVDNPDPRTVAAIKAKRAWLRGEISDDELKKAEKAAQSVANSIVNSSAQGAAQSAVWAAAKDIVCAIPCDILWDDTWDDTWDITWDVVWFTKYQWQVDELRKMLQE